MMRLPLRFEENRGQAPGEARFLARSPEGVFVMTGTGPEWTAGGKRVGLRLRGSAVPKAIQGERRMAAPTSYFVGSRKDWRAGVANYGQVRYRGVYPGIDAVYYGNQSQLEYDFVVAPGADARAIRMQFDGADRVRVTPGGDLSVEAGGAPMVQKKPRAYQDGREVAAHYRVNARGEVAIDLGRYDHRRELVIDPILVYCTYFGTSGYDQVTSVKMGPKGMLYVTGSTNTSELPYIDGAYNNNNTGMTDIFLTVLDTNNPSYTPVYFSYFGGSNVDIPLAMAVDERGVAYLTGSTRSTDFPLAGINVNSTGAASTLDAFVIKFDPSQWGTSALLYSTYLGGATGDNVGNAIAIDKSHNIYVVGTTKSTDFPVTSSAYAAVLYGPQDAFISQINPDSATPLVYSTYMGGELADDGRAVAVGSNGLVYFACSTISTLFPMEGPGYRQTLQGGIDVAMGVIDPTQSGEASMKYSTYLGGSSLEEVRAMTLDAKGNVVLTGYTLSSDYPTTGDALSQQPLGNADVFVTVMNPADPRNVMVYSTYFGGSDGDVAY
ncbi:MAG: SBBP repeat-containing protein, partial [Acidobacteriota bacterium]|nr:SBBP repeat-containing protein [Acidobacteriota bacterium]